MAEIQKPEFLRRIGTPSVRLKDVESFLKAVDTGNQEALKIIKKRPFQWWKEVVPADQAVEAETERYFSNPLLIATGDLNSCWACLGRHEVEGEIQGFLAHKLMPNKLVFEGLGRISKEHSSQLKGALRGECLILHPKGHARECGGYQYLETRGDTGGLKPRDVSEEEILQTMVEDVSALLPKHMLSFRGYEQGPAMEGHRYMTFPRSLFFEIDTGEWIMPGTKLQGKVNV
ncbi:MAG: hypothetical protein ABH851_07240 [Methanobacteriota archaeon]